MSTYNMFSSEVSNMRTTISDYGGPKKYREQHRPTSYKQQALVELASRLELEDKLEHAKRRIASLVDRIESLELERDLAAAQIGDRVTKKVQGPFYPENRGTVMMRPHGLKPIEPLVFWDAGFVSRDGEVRRMTDEEIKKYPAPKPAVTAPAEPEATEFIRRMREENPNLRDQI